MRVPRGYAYGGYMPIARAKCVAGATMIPATKQRVLRIRVFKIDRLFARDESQGRTNGASLAVFPNGPRDARIASA
jgi:hypothetical protein